MKAAIYDLKGEKKGEIEMPKLFDRAIREDIAAKYFESDKMMKQKLYSSFAEAGKRHSASGTISHRRHEWKGHYGKGISRVPRKAMWRRGTQFYWVGAEVTGTRGGRQAHPPLGIRTPRKINDKERIIAMQSALASTASTQFVQKRYSNMPQISIHLPIVIHSSSAIKTKELVAMFEKILGNLSSYAFKQKQVRPGKGKLRGRRYKSTAGMLIVEGKDENLKTKGLDIVKVNELEISDLYPLGRLTAFTEKAIKEIGENK